MTPNDTTAPAPDAFQGLVDTARFQRARRIPIADFAYPEGVKIAAVSEAGLSFANRFTPASPGSDRARTATLVTAVRSR